MSNLVHKGPVYMDIETIRERVRDGNYLVKSHAVQHALKEGFERKHIVEAILNGSVIEEYPADQRVLICGSMTIAEALHLYLHVVCEYADPVQATQAIEDIAYDN